MNFFDIQCFEKKDIIFLSPHFDDVAFSCGGLIRKIKNICNRIIIVNVFTKSIWAPYMEITQKSEDLVSKIRYNEDLSYCNSLNIENIRLGFIDSSLRGYDDVTELLAEVNNDYIYFSVKYAILDILKSLCVHYVFCPSGIGNHIDHVIVFEAIKEFENIEKIFYEDMPYACSFTSDQNSVFVFNKTKYQNEFYIDITETFDQMLNDIKAYSSQIGEEIYNKLVYSLIRYSYDDRKYIRFWK
jgi:LmbE family N-acetylglucosaminyl deacetylase